TVQQMLMFLTRMGEGSKAIVTGDDSQVDLLGHQKSGLYDAVQRLGRIPQIAIVRLGQQDIVRHKLVTHIVEAYGNGGAARRRAQESAAAHGREPEDSPEIEDAPPTPARRKRR